MQTWQFEIFALSVFSDRIVASNRKWGKGCVMQESEHHFGCIWEHGKITLRGNNREYLYKIAAGSYPKIENLQ